MIRLRALGQPVDECWRAGISVVVALGGEGVLRDVGGDRGHRRCVANALYLQWFLSVGSGSVEDVFEHLSPNGIIAAALIAPPGADVIAALATIDPKPLSDYMKVDFMVAIDQQKAWLEALDQPAVAAVGDAVETAVGHDDGKPDPDQIGLRAAHAEIAAALRVSDCVAAEKLDVARELTTELPAVQRALAAGEISIWHARAIVEATRPLSRDKARIVADRVLPRARRQTVAQLRRCLKRAVLAVEPRSAAERAKQAHAERTLDWWPREDGMAELRLIASASDVMTVFNVADAIAKHAKADGPKQGEPGWLPIDALRADALIALMTQGAATVQPPAVNVTVDLPTLLGLQENPAELAGYGPIPAELARILAADGRWRRMILEPESGDLLDLGHSSYKPSAELSRFVKTRDRTCTFPCCNRAADHGDLDHKRPYRDDPEGGRTDRANLHPPCKNHHVLKHKGRWTLRTKPDTGHRSWISPTGHSYDIEPVDHRSEAATVEKVETKVDVCPF